jgi:uncharacterized RDD family membrane protein YckC
MPTQHSGNLYCPLPEKRTTAELVGAQSNLEMDGYEAQMTAVAEPLAAAKREFTSTLIEFPKRKNNNEAEWRDAVRERVRAARERRDGGAEETEKPIESRVEAAKQKAAAMSAASATVVNLKPNVENRPATKLIARALERVERSRQIHHSNGTAVALAPVFEPQEEMPAPKLQAAPKPAPVALVPPPAEIEAKSKPAPRKIEMPPLENCLDYLPKTAENVAAYKVETTIKSFETIEVGAPGASKKEPRKLPMISEAEADQFIESQMRVSAATPQKKPSPRSGGVVEQEIAPRVRESAETEIVEDYAPLGLRFVAGLLDFALCAGLTAGLFALFAPAGYFSAEKFGFASFLTVLAVFAVVKFVYLTAALVLTETTVAGRFFSLRTVHAEDGSAPTIFEAALNTLGYLVSLALLGAGLISILLSTERRAAHDLLSGTVVIREN